MENQILDVVVTIVVALLSSTGLWKILESKREAIVKKTEDDYNMIHNTVDLLVSLARAQICNMACIYIERGYITTSELDILTSLYKPYHELGGNGVAEKMYTRCQELPIRSDYDEKNEKA